MDQVIKENSWPVMLSIGLHVAIAAALVLTSLISADKMTIERPSAPVNAVVVDSQVLKSYQRAQSERAAAAAQATAQAAAQAAAQAREAEQARAAAAEAQNARIAAEAKAATEAQAAAEAKAAEQAQAAAAAKAAAESRAAAQARAQAEARAAAAREAQEAEKRAAEKRAQEAKAAADAKAAEARRLADLQAKADREAELRRQIAEEEHVQAVEASPLRDRYIASLQNRIQNAWIKPPSARVGIDCRVQVTQVPGGAVASVSIKSCNGDAAVRQSIENAVYGASPLPDPPDPALFQRNFEIEFKPDE